VDTETLWSSQPYVGGWPISNYLARGVSDRSGGMGGYRVGAWSLGSHPWPVGYKGRSKCPPARHIGAGRAALASESCEARASSAPSRRSPPWSSTRVGAWTPRWLGGGHRADLRHVVDLLPHSVRRHPAGPPRARIPVGVRAHPDLHGHRGHRRGAARRGLLHRGPGPYQRRSDRAQHGRPGGGVRAHVLRGLHLPGQGGDPFHISLLVGTAVVLAAAVWMAAAGVPVAWCLLIVMLAPAVTVVGYEAPGLLPPGGGPGPKPVAGLRPSDAETGV
jgi:hypothetical protein